MIDISNFDKVFPQDAALPTSHSAARLKTIKHNRSKLHGLFFDRICNSLNLREICDHYPPKDERTLRVLHRKIVEADIGLQHQAALLFYILLDLQASAGAADLLGEEAIRFAKSIGLGRSFQTAVAGFWEMDRLEFRSALDHLTQPSLLPTFSSEVLEILLANSKEQSLPLAYYHAVSPPLPLGSSLRKSFFKYLTEINPTQVFYMSRSQPDRRELFELMIQCVLSCPPDEDRTDLSMLLIDLPLDENEEQWWEEYLTGRGGRGLPNAMDLLHMRHIATGRVSKAAESLGIEGRLRGKPIDGVDWDVIRDGVVKGTGGRKGLETF